MASVQPLSLIAEFDDLVRCRTALTAGIETEFEEFVRSQETCRKRWLHSEIELEHMKEGVAEKDKENTALETKLKHARNQIDHEMRKRQRAEQERDAAERQISLVRELLSDKQNRTILNEKDREKLAFLDVDVHVHGSHIDHSLRNIAEASGSLLSPSDISFDKTEEDLDTSFLRSGKKWKRGSSVGRQSTAAEDDDVNMTGKRRRRTHRRSNSADCSGTVFGLPGITEEPPSSKTERERRFSSPGIRETDPVDTAIEDGQRYGAMTRQGQLSTPVTDTPGALRRCGSGNTLTKPHIFFSQSCLRTSTCNACGKKLRFGKPVFKCRDCKVASHGECRGAVPLPCIPSVHTPSGSKHALMSGVVADYAPFDPPMIPALVVHCIKEVDNRGMSEVGIYRVPGNEKDVKELKDRFLRGKCPNLALVGDIHVVCGCLKDFLRGLKEPLVTHQLWMNFVAAAELSDKIESITDIYQAVSKLPQPNRDTLAYLILHLQRVSECTDCKMPASNLAKVFGPTVVGYSAAEAEPMQMLAETTKQAKVMERLLSISSDYWSMFVNIEGDCTREFGTPRLSEVAPSLLGPIGTTPNFETPDKSRWFTPRSGRNQPLSARKAQFFSSPMLK